jgi:hypothetical protein
VPALADDLALALDPVRLAARAGLDPDPWQATLLRSTAPRILLNCSRQSGKSTITAALAVWTAVYEPGALVLLLSPSQRQSGELFKKAIGVYRTLGRPVPAESETALQLTLENGSRLVALPGKEETIRGYSGVRLLCVDEAARVDDGLYRSVRPFLAVSGGRLVALSTPFGKRGWWFEEWTSGGQGWERYEVPATECPRIPAAFLEEERRSLGPWWYQQEYECQFSETTAQLFDYDALMATVRPDIAPLFAGAAPGG